MRLKSMFLATLLVLVACSNVKDDPLPLKLDQSSDEWTRIMKGLNQEDRKLFMAYVVRTQMGAAFGGKRDPEIVTVDDALKAQKKWADDLAAKELESQRLAEEVKAKQAAAAEAINKSVTVGLVSIRVIPEDIMNGRYSDYSSIKLVIENKSAKDIKGLRGDSVWINTFGEEYHRLTTNVEERIAAGQKLVWAGGKEINEFLDDDKKLMQIDDNYKYRFEPRMIVFADGTTIGSPDASERE